MTVPSKLKVFILRVMYDALSVCSQLFKRIFPVDPRCSQCGLQETVAHALFMCEEVRRVWKEAGLWEELKKISNGDAMDTILGV